MSEPSAKYNGQSPTLPTFPEWLEMMRRQGWAGGNGGGWIRASSTPKKTTFSFMTNDEAMEFFRAGETPPPIDWEDLPFSEPVGES